MLNAIRYLLEMHAHCWMPCLDAQNMEIETNQRQRNTDMQWKRRKQGSFLQSVSSDLGVRADSFGQEATADLVANEAR